MTFAPDAAALFELLEGQWQLERRIPEMQAAMRGTARFVRTPPANGNALDYREDGELHLLATNEKLQSFRSYRYVCEPDAIVTYFSDGPDVGKLFQRLKLLCAPQASAVVMLEGDHTCGSDDYHSTYQFIDVDRFDVTHRVRGPAKDYTSTTVYRRIRSDASPSHP